MDHVRLVTGDEMETEDRESVPTNRTPWWVVLLLILQTLTLASMAGNIHVTNSAVRRELEENAALIKQIQELQSVRELSKLKRSE